MIGKEKDKKKRKEEKNLYAIHRIYNEKHQLTQTLNLNCIHGKPFIRRSNVSQLVSLCFGSRRLPILCQMGDFGCGDGGWTPVMKINGSNV